MHWNKFLKHLKKLIGFIFITIFIDLSHMNNMTLANASVVNKSHYKLYIYNDMQAYIVGALTEIVKALLFSYLMVKTLAGEGILCSLTHCTAWQ